MIEIVSHTHFLYFVTAMVVGVCGVWVFVDAIRLRRALREPPSPLVRDRIFGSVIGLVMNAIGLYGAYAFWS